MQFISINFPELQVGCEKVQNGLYWPNCCKMFILYERNACCLHFFVCCSFVLFLYNSWKLLELVNVLFGYFDETRYITVLLE